MLRALSVAVLSLFLAGFVLAESSAVLDMEHASSAVATQSDGDCGNGLDSAGCHATCAACSAFAANAVFQFPAVDFHAPGSRASPARADVARAPDAAPPKSLLG